MPSSVHIRLNTLMLLLILIVGVAIVAMLATGARGGPLDPTSAPGSTDGVREPGTPITSIPITITQPGYYYLTRNLTAAADNQNGITIDADYVTLDLKGFTLTGSNRTGVGIGAVNHARQLSVLNGNIVRWATGVDGLLASYAEYDHLRAGDNLTGMTIFSSTVQDCSIDENNTVGIVLSYSTIRQCQITANSFNGISATSASVIEENRFEMNSQGSTGFADIDVTGNDNVIKDNTSRTAPGAFVRLETGAASNAIMRNRYICTLGIVTNASFNYIPTTIYPNICF
jgi:hypothetical protein